jgi:membrane-associated protease RseP (regulator of RpoE activity)
LFSATIHELGHLIVARILNINLKELKVGIFGAGLSCDTYSLSYKDEILLCLGGPFINLISASLCYAFLKNYFVIFPYIKTFVFSSLFLGLINLLPIKDFDGGRIFYALLAKKFSPKISITIQKYISFVIVFIMWSFSLFLLIKYSFSLSLFIFSLSLFVKIFMAENF